MASLELADRALKSYERDRRFLHTIRVLAILSGATCLAIGAVMIFLGLEGSVDWSVKTPNSTSSEVEGAGPGIIFAAIGLFIIWCGLKKFPTTLTIKPSTPATSGLEEYVSMEYNLRKKLKVLLLIKIYGNYIDRDELESIANEFKISLEAVEIAIEAVEAVMKFERHKSPRQPLEIDLRASTPVIAP